MAAAKEENAEKIIVYAKQHDEPILAKQLFAPEGYLKGYYLGHSACVMVRYLSESRRQTDSYTEEQEIIEAIYRTAPVFATTVHRFYDEKSRNKRHVPAIDAV